MRDFTPHAYQALLQSLKDAGYATITMTEYCSSRPSNSSRYVILRHDVDLNAAQSLKIAQIEHQLGMRASYYFRIIPESNQPEIIRQIADLGHEIGYHYEDMAMCNGDMEKAITHFRHWLQYFRQFYSVQTICMHGAPTSKYDGRDLWKTYDYHDEGIIGEPYFDADFSDMLYLTDTGRCWDGYKVSVRDKIPVYQDEWVKQNLVFHHTWDICQWLAGNHEKQPDMPHIMITTHPQRWLDNRIGWIKEACLQRIKNTIKRLLILVR